MDSHWQQKQAHKLGQHYIDPQAEQTGDSSESSSPGMLRAVVFSLLFHVMLIAVLWSNKISSPIEQKPEYVQINLLPENPLLVEQNTVPAEAEQQQQIATVDLPAESEFEEVSEDPLPQPVAEPVNEIALDPEISLPDLPKAVIDESEPVETTTANARQLNLLVPSIVTIKNAVQESWPRQQRNYLLADCNLVLEEENGMECNDTSQLDYSALQNNEVYRSLNPVRTVSRAQQSLGAVGSLASNVSSRLDSAALPDGLADYLVEELEAGITINSNIGNRQLRQIRRMIDQSAAAQQAERVLGDAWIQQRSRQLNQRKIVDR
jgi:hypothetical protein